MGISNQSSGSRPGVCTSTTRPTAPYEGQMIYETDTDLTYIYNGSSWQQISGGTSVGNSGLVYINSISSTGTPSSLASPANVFSSTYDSYKIVISNLSISADASVRLTFGSTSGGYYYGTPLVNMSSGAFDWDKGYNVGYISLGVAYSAYGNAFSFDVFNPNKTTATRVSGFGYVNSTSYGGLGNGTLLNNTAYTDFTITLSTGTMNSCTLTIYGYRK